MVGLRFDDFHSYYDLGLILTTSSIESPSVKSQTVDIAGGDGVLDLTDYFGEPKFNNRVLTFTFQKVHNSLIDFKHDWSFIQNNLTGQKMKIVLDEEPDMYYYGRLSTEYTRSKNISTITITCDCEPYKMNVFPTEEVTYGSGSCDLYNFRKKVVPTVSTQYETKITFGDYVTNLSKGSYVVPELELSQGSNVVKVETADTPNLISYPYYWSSKTINGLNCTVNADKTVSISGTATADTYFYVTSNIYDDALTLESGKYKLTGCPEGGAEKTYNIGVAKNINGVRIRIAADTGNGITFDTVDDVSAKYDINLSIYKGNTVDVTFNPALRLIPKTSFEYVEGGL